MRSLSAICCLLALLLAPGVAASSADRWTLEQAFRAWRAGGHAQVLLYIARSLEPEERPGARAQRQLLRSGVPVELVAALAGEHTTEAQVRALEPARVAYRGMIGPAPVPERGRSPQVDDWRDTWAALSPALDGDLWRDGAASGAALHAGALRGQARWRIDDSGVALIALDLENTGAERLQVALALAGGAPVDAAGLASRLTDRSRWIRSWLRPARSYTSPHALGAWPQSLAAGASVYDRAQAPSGAVYKGWASPDYAYAVLAPRRHPSSPLEWVVAAAVEMELARVAARYLSRQISLAPGERVERIAAFHLDGSRQTLALQIDADDARAEIALGASTVAPMSWRLDPAALAEGEALPASVLALLAQRRVEGPTWRERLALRDWRQRLAQSAGHPSAAARARLVDAALSGTSWGPWRPFEVEQCVGRARWFSHPDGAAIEVEAQATGPAASPLHVYAMRDISIAQGRGTARSPSYAPGASALSKSRSELYRRYQSALIAHLEAEHDTRAPWERRRSRAAAADLSALFSAALAEHDAALSAGYLPSWAEIPSGETLRGFAIMPRAGALDTHLSLACGSARVRNSRFAL